MLLEPLPFEFADGRRPASPYVGLARPGMGAIKGIFALSEKQETDWSALMLAVRDAGDRAAFARLFRHFAPRVKSYLMKSGASAARAEECAQDVMTTLWQKASLFDPGRASVSTWIFTIARNRMIDMVRRDRRPDPEPMPWDRDAEPDQAEVYAAAEESRTLTAALSDLPEKQRSLITRAFYGDLSHSEIALETGLPLGTIKSRIRLALDRLRARMSES
jgi:RNA polymerase sigma factor (sigma-70 family)